MSAVTLSRGAAFGRYTVLDPIGHGPMSEVYAAYDPELDRKVALKILRDGGEGPEAPGRSRLLREAKAIAKLRHPNVVVVHEAGTLDERVFLAMEYVEGQTLAAWLADRTHGRQEILEVFIAAGHGVAAARAAGLVGRDFEPQNVMVGRDGSVRVMDFELAATEPSEAAPAGPGDLAADQFSFCVALYQALYGAHPFGDVRPGAPMAAGQARPVHPPPPKSTVPAWLRRVLVRGLNGEPSERWESMEALLAALSRDPARRRRRLLLGGAAVVVVAGLAWAAWAPRHAESICRGGPARVADVWETDGSPNAAGPRRAATRAAFLKTGLSSAGDIWERTVRLLDKYTTGWLAMYRDACEATHVRGEQSAAVLDLRMGCLSDRLQRFKALTDVLADATPTVVENAIQAASALPALDRCADIPLLRAAVPPPEDPKARARVEGLRRDLARVKALGDSGQCTAAVAAGRALLAEAEKVGYQPLQGEGLLELARRGSQCTGNEETRGNSRRAALVGLAVHDEEVAAQGAIFIGHALVDRTSDLALGRDWLDLAAAIMQGMSRPHPVFEAWRLEAVARGQQRVGDFKPALASLQHARELLETAYGAEHLDISIVLNDIGLALAESGRLEEAVSYYRRSQEVALEVGGPDHVLVENAFSNAAEALNALGRYDEARVAAEQALAVSHRAGSHAFYEGLALNSLGQALFGLGRPAEAVDRLEQARTLFGDDRSTYPAEVRFALARALWTWPDKRPRALALAREAEAGYQRLGTGAGEAAKVHAWLGAHPGARRGSPPQ